MQIVETDFPEVREVDLKLIELARRMSGKIVTNDFNLNKVAQLRGVPVLNINELANSLKPVVLPGEVLRVFVIKEGKESAQGVAYLDDGTMVVVDQGRKAIGKTIEVTVTSVLQTTAGKMIFCRWAESGAPSEDSGRHARVDRRESHRPVNRVGNGRDYRRDERYAMADQPTPAMPRVVEPASHDRVVRAPRATASGATPSAGLPSSRRGPHSASGISPIPPRSSGRRRRPTRRREPPPDGPGCSRPLALLGARLRAAAEPSPEALRRRIDAVVSRRAFAPAFWGIEVRGLRTGGVLYARAADKNLRPGSTMKLVTTAAALDVLGPDARLRTTVETRRPPRRDGPPPGRPVPGGPRRPEPVGPLQPRGGSPPGSRTWPTSSGRRECAAIEGRLVGHEGAFTGERRGSDWTWEDLVWSYGAEVSALSFNDNAALAAPATRRAGRRSRRARAGARQPTTTGSPRRPRPRRPAGSRASPCSSSPPPTSSA